VELGEVLQVPLPNSYIDLLDDKIFSFKSSTGWEERYPTRSVKEVSSELVSELSAAGKAMFDVFNKTSCILRSASPELTSMLHLPATLHSFMPDTMPFDLCSYMSRLDFILDGEGNFKLIEINSDTPCAVVESFYANKIACDFNSLRDPNAGMVEHIKEMFSSVIDGYKAHGFKTESVCFSSHESFREDFDTANFLMNSSGLNAFYAPLHDLRITDEGLFVYGKKIDVLYRLHPMEMLVEDTDVDGFETGLALIGLVKQKKLVMVNPPTAILMQLKSLYAFIWALKDQAGFFTDHEKAMIEKYMLPSYMTLDKVANMEYVEKPIFGREGSGISVYDAVGALVESSNDDKDNGPVMYQQFCPNKDEICVTDRCEKTGKLTYSVFNFMGKSSAVFCRFNEGLIAGKDAFWLPLGVK
jgi:glutathionylspermidine synthase